MLITHRSPLIEAIDPMPAVTVAVIDEVAPRTRGLRTGPIRRTHPGCAECCGKNLCHWCVRPAKRAEPFGGLMWYRWDDDGCEYCACEDHVRDLRAAVLGETSPNAVMTVMAW